MTKVRAAIALQQRAPGGQRHYGFAISFDAGRPRYVRMNDVGEWSWTADRHEAELFPNKERAEAWAARNIGGGKPKAVEVVR